MSALKVSLTFLDGPPSLIITKCTHIARCMTGNTNFPIPPVSPSGLQTAVDYLKKMQGKVKGGNGKDSSRRDAALADVDDYIRQEAEYVNRACNYDMEKLLSSGFEMLQEQKPVSPMPAIATRLTLRNGKRPGEVIAGIDMIQHCRIAIGRISADPEYPSSTTSEVDGTSRTRVFFSALPSDSQMWVSVKCRGAHGDSDWGPSVNILVR